MCRYLEGEGFETTMVEVDGDGLVDPSSVERAIRSDTVLVFIMHANNEVETIQPVSDIAGIARSRGIICTPTPLIQLAKYPST